MTVGSSWESSSTICASRRSASTPSEWPCGAHTTVARSGTSSASTIVSSFSRCLGPMCRPIRSRPTAIVPGPANCEVPISTRASIVSRPSLTEHSTSRDGW